MDVSDLKTLQLARKMFPIELRVGARARYTPDIDDKLDLRGAKKIHELGDRPGRMPDGEKTQRHTEDREKAPARNKQISTRGPKYALAENVSDATFLHVMRGKVS